ncbi:MAG: hypothetical protein ACYCVY_13025 [Acidiferrobacteraceae bacterium]
MRDAARLLSKSPGSLRNEISSGNFPVRSIRIGGRRVIPILAFADYLNSITNSPPTPGRPRTGGAA